MCALLLASGCAAAPSRLAGGRDSPALEETSCASSSEFSSDVRARTVRQLASADFELRARAAQALVAAGDESLPALGRAGDLPVRVDGGLQVSATRSVVRSVLAGSSDEGLMEHLGSPWANVRREAASELGQRDRWSAVPRLIDHLEDADPEVRAASANALRRVTNNFFGYRAMASASHRRASADRWRAWWSQEGRARDPGPRFGARLTAEPGR